MKTKIYFRSHLAQFFSERETFQTVVQEIKGKGKVHPRTGHEGPEGD
jgi:hypothetical protein